MKLPWKLKDELKDELEEKEEQIEELKEEKQKWQNRYEAEKERRSELSRKKQEAEEERNKLEKKLQNTGNEESEEEERADGKDFRSLDFDDTKKLLQKIGSIESPQRELVTIYCPGKVEDLSDLKSLKNSVDREAYSVLQERKSFVAFIDPELGVFLLEMAPFFSEYVSVGKEFEVDSLIDFLESEKHWCVFSAGETAIYREEDGEFEELESVKSRVDREHSKGGFSQGRFERKRDEQIENHLEKSEELLDDYPGACVLGDRRFCEDLPGEYLGGFDGNRKKPEQFYRFRFAAVF